MIDRLSNHAIIAALIFLVGKGMGMLAIVATFTKMMVAGIIFGSLWGASIIASIWICIDWFIKYRASLTEGQRNLFVYKPVEK